jgi:hypothetical protein
VPQPTAHPIQCGVAVNFTTIKEDLNIKVTKKYKNRE